MDRKSNPNIVKRFKGTLGKQRLIDTLLSQPLLSACVEAANEFSKCVKLIEFPANHEFISQGNQDNDLYFILSGSVRILVNTREIAVRRAGDHVGEMALIDQTAIRSSTIITTETSVVARVSEPDFTKIANSHPVIWRKAAGIIAQRLRERNRFHPPPRSIPTVFIGSSSESIDIAKAIQKSLHRKQITPHIWTNGVFQCSHATINDLLEECNQSDFAILILAADDIITSRGKKLTAPRDNTIFELGLFMGALSPNRTYIVVKNPLDIKIPTDILGITLLTYQKKRGQSIARAIHPVTVELIRLVTKYGPK